LNFNFPHRKRHGLSFLQNVRVDLESVFYSGHPKAG